MDQTTDASGLRPALYYPYIHIRSERWLKATLLCVPTVKRIVPVGYTPEDEPAITAYTTTTGPYGQLLQSVPTDTPAAGNAQGRLLDQLRENARTIRKKYTRSRAPVVDSYWIHEAKFTHALLEYLQEHYLAWPSAAGDAVGNRTWCALHPTLGKAIMTTLGLSIATEQRYDIVTADGKYHEALLATEEDALFEALLNGGRAQVEPTSVQARNDLGQRVITMTGVNYRALLPISIAELQASPHFRTFQRLLRTSASSVDHNADPQEYDRQLQEEANQIISAWHDTKHDVSKELGKALFDEAITMSGEALKALTIEPNTKALAIAGGLAICKIAAATWRATRKRQQTYAFLTEVVKAQHQVLRLMYPLALADGE